MLQNLSPVNTREILGVREKMSSMLASSFLSSTEWQDWKFCYQFLFLRCHKNSLKVTYIQTKSILTLLWTFRHNFNLRFPLFYKLSVLIPPVMSRGFPLEYLLSINIEFSVDTFELNSLNLTWSACFRQKTCNSAKEFAGNIQQVNKEKIARLSYSFFQSHYDHYAISL